MVAVTLQRQAALLLAFSTVLPFVVSWIPVSTRSANYQRRKTHLWSSSQDFEGKTIFQRLFYRLSSGSDVDVHDSITVEERARFRLDPEREGYLKPVGHRTLILREGANEDVIGDEIFRLDVHDGRDTHSGAGVDLDSTIATILYIASNPSLAKGQILELSCDLGLASLLGCVGAAHTLQKSDPSADKPSSPSSSSMGFDVLTVPDHDSVLPRSLEKLTLSDGDETRLNLAFHIVKNSNIPPEQVSIEEIDWTRRQQRRGGLKEYDTVIVTDVDFSFPEAKELARTAAYSLKGPRGTSTMAPSQFVHLCPEVRAESRCPDLVRLLEKGYRMSVDTKYLKMEKWEFKFQTIPIGAPEKAIEELEELEVQQDRQLLFHCLTAQHHPDYPGEGSGELFFPMETGEYDQGSSRTYLEPDSSGNKLW